MFGREYFCVGLVSLGIAGSVFAAELTIGDLPSAGQTLTITEDSFLTISPGQSITLNGNIMVQESASFVLTNHGEFTIATAGCHTADGGTFSLVNTGQVKGGSLNFGATGAAANATINNEGSINLTNTNFIAAAGADFTLKNIFGSFEIQNMAVDASGGSTVNYSNGYLKVGNWSMQNSGSDITFKNGGYWNIGSINATTTGGGSTQLLNGGVTEAKTISMNTYGGNVVISNDGWMDLNVVNLLDQSDAELSAEWSTRLVNNTTIVGHTLNLTANGEGGQIDVLLHGSEDIGSVNGNANYGGSLHLLSDAGAIINAIMLAANGASNGKPSTIDLDVLSDKAVLDSVGLNAVNAEISINALLANVETWDLFANASGQSQGDDAFIEILKSLDSDFETRNIKPAEAWLYALSQVDGFQQELYRWASGLPGEIRIISPLTTPIPLPAAAVPGMGLIAGIALASITRRLKPPLRACNVGGRCRSYPTCDVPLRASLTR